MAQTTTRRRWVVGTVDQACASCGHAGLELVESARDRSGPAPVRRLRRSHTRRYTRCPACGARGAPAAHPSTGSTVLAGLGLGLVGLFVLLETLVLAAMTTLISVPLAVVPVLAVGAIVGLIIWDARRHARR